MQRKRLKIVGLVLWAVLLSKPVHVAAERFIHGHRPEQNREMMEYVSSRYKDGDFFYLYSMAQFPYWYYGKLTGLNQRLDKPIKIGSTGLSGVEAVKIYTNIRRDQAGEYMRFAYIVDGYKKDIFRGSFIWGGSKVFKLYKDTELPVINQERAWVLLSHLDDEKKQFILEAFSNQGKLLDSWSGKGAHAFLFDFSRNSSSNK